MESAARIAKGMVSPASPTGSTRSAGSSRSGARRARARRWLPDCPCRLGDPARHEVLSAAGGAAARRTTEQPARALQRAPAVTPDRRHDARVLRRQPPAIDDVVEADVDVVLVIGVGEVLGAVDRPWGPDLRRTNRGVEAAQSLGEPARSRASGSHDLAVDGRDVEGAA